MGECGYFSMNGKYQEILSFASVVSFSQHDLSVRSANSVTFYTTVKTLNTGDFYVLPVLFAEIIEKLIRETSRKRRGYL